MQYFRVFPSKRMRHICWIMIALLATYGTWAVLSAFLNCVPVARFWDPTVAGTCLSSKGLWFSNASMHIATDLAILVIPIPALAALELPKKQKVALISIFALGGLYAPLPYETSLEKQNKEQANYAKIQRLRNQRLPPSRPKEDFRLIRPNLYVPPILYPSIPLIPN